MIGNDTPRVLNEIGRRMHDGGAAVVSDAQFGDYIYLFFYLFIMNIVHKSTTEK